MMESSPAASPARAELIAYIDGGSRGNPGPAGYGVVIQDARGRTLEAIAEHIGEATNNVAEYRALLAALDYAVGKRARRLKIFCDSELVVRQMLGRYRVQSLDLKPLHARARQLAGGLERFAIEHIPRERNALADRLANQAMDQAQSSSASPVYSLVVRVEDGKLRPLPPAPPLEEGAEYDARLRKRTPPRNPARK